MALLANSAEDIGVFLNRLWVYAARKRLRVNAEKTKVMVFWRRSNQTVRFEWGGQPLEVVDEFKYLGILFTSNGRMKKAAERMQVPFALAMARVRTLIKQEGLTEYTFAYVWLFQVLALSASLYGCQVWSTPFLPPAKAEHTVLSRSHALFFKRVLGLPCTASNCCVLRECGQLPLQFYWARCVLRFWNACLTSTNPLVCRGLQADWHLAVHHNHQSGWVADLLRYLAEPGAHNAWKHQFADRIKSFAPIGLNQFTKQWVAADIAAWQVYDGREPFHLGNPQLSRVLCAYHTYFAVRPYSGLSWRDPRKARHTDKPAVPRYFYAPLRPEIALARFRLSAHPLRVVRGRYSGEDYYDRTCLLTDFCRHMLYVQDEWHVIFQCHHPAIRALQVHFEYLFDVCASTSDRTEKLQLFVNQPDVIEVAKSVRQLQTIVEHFMEAPTHT